MVMNKRLLFFAVALCLAAAFAASAEKDKKDGSWTGWITDSQCGSRGEPKPDHGKCADGCVKRGAKYVLYNSADKKVYALDAQDKAAPLSGKHVKVSGTVEGETIKVKAIEATGEQKGHDHK
jgi:hypothetical protein